MPTMSIIRLLMCASAAAWWLATVVPVAAQTGLSAESNPLPRRGALRFLTGSEFPPFHYYDDEGVLTGFDVDLARAICLELTAACDIKVRTWDELLPALRRGESDAVIASHAITPQALTYADFTDRYYYTPAWFAGARADAKLDITPETMAGRKVGVTKGTAHEAYLRAFFRNASIQVFDTPEQGREALMARSVPLLFDDGISLVFWLNGTASKACCELKGGPYFDPKYFSDGIGIAVSKTDPQLKSLLNRALRRIRETGRYEELLLRYFPTRLY
jgi:polar amino acid transport system substrate-binding protein